MFSLGIVRRRTPEERRRYHQEQGQRRRIQQLRHQRSSSVHLQSRQQVQQSSTSSHSPVKQWKSFQDIPSWNLIPKEKFKNQGLYFSMCFDYPSFAHRYTHFQNFGYWIGFPSQPVKDSLLIEELNREAKEKYLLNQTLRQAFKRLISTYLHKRMKIMNEKDPITLELPKQSVFLYDHANRSTFQFEAKELLRDFSSRLLSHEDLFPTPLFLRNPLTNAKLHLGQMISLYVQIKAFGHMHWTLECFQDARFEMKIFSRENHRKLRLSALKDLMRSPERCNFILDFIEAQHDILNKPFDLRTYQWALRTNKCYSMERIQSWKTMCYTFYEIEITEDDLIERQRKMNKLTPILLNLCSPAVEILLAKRSSYVPKP